MKRVCMACLAAILAVACCIGCGGGKLKKHTGPVSIDVAEDLKATLTIATKNGDAEIDLVNQVTAVFNKTYKNVAVQVVPFSNDVYPYMMSAIKTESVPDIVISTSFEMFQLNNSGVLMNLQPYIDAETQANAFDVNDYYTMFFKAGQQNFNGDQYLIPRSADRVVCHYNADLIAQANTWYQTSPVYDVQKCENLTDLIVNGWTWDDFLYVCSVLRAWFNATGRSDNYLLDSSFDWEAVWNPILTSYGVKYIGENNTVLIHSDQTKQALDFMKSLVTNKYTSSTSANFYGGKGVFFFHSQSALDAAAKIGQTSAYYDAAQSKNYSSYYNVVTMPVKSGAEKIGAGVAGYCVSAYSQVGDIAWKWLKTLLSQEGQNAMSGGGKLNYVPVRKDMADATQWNWGNDLGGVNLAAYTYNAGIGSDPDWNCFTDFFLKKPSQALNLLNCVDTMVSSYVFDASAPSASKVMSDCASSVTGYLKMR